MADDIVIEDLKEGLNFEEAVRKAASGQFEHTLFEMWEQAIQTGIRGLQSPLNLPTANSILRSWPMLKFKDIKTYLHRREVRMAETLDVLQGVYGDNKERIFTENVDDWAVHKDLYIDTIVVWTELTNTWAEEWMEMEESPDKIVEMAVIIDMQSLLMEGEGFISQMRDLHGFNITEEEGENITKRLIGVSDE
jgi:hypothetical protein